MATTSAGDFEAVPFSGILEHSLVGIYAIGDHGKFSYTNPKFSEITGYTAEELRSMGPLDVVHPEDIESVSGEIASLFSGETTTVTTAHRAVRKDGTVINFEVIGNRVMIDGRPMIVGTLADTTEKVLADQELRNYRYHLEQVVTERTAELRAVNRELNTFTYSASHDLRAPVRSVLGFGQALMEEYGHRLDDQGLDYLNRILKAGRLMTELIDDLLSLSRVTRATLEFVPVDLTAIVRAIASDLQEHAPDRSVVFDIQDGVTAKGDPHLLRVVMDNLLANAWKYTGGRDQAHIEFGSVVHGEYLRCFVRDNGVGFDMAYADRLFQPFQRLHSPAEFEGNGIGLATVRRIVERHLGTAWGQAALDEGAEFWFEIPLDGAGPLPRMNSTDNYEVSHMGISPPPSSGA